MHSIPAVLRHLPSVCARQRVASFVLAVCVATGIAEAQRAPTSTDAWLPQGARVRLTPKSESSVFPRAEPRIGTVQSLLRDSMAVRWLDGETSTVPLLGIDRIEMSRGRRRFVRDGIIVGGLVGATVGGILGGATYTEREYSCTGGCLFGNEELFGGQGFHIAMGAAAGGLGGVFVGGVTGAIGIGEAWHQVPLDAITQRVSVRLSPGPGSASVAVAVSW